MPIIKKPFTLAPLNDNPVVLTQNGANMDLTGGFSHRGGFPTVKFSMPPQPVMLEMGSLKLTGQILVKDANNQAMISSNAGVINSNGRSGATGQGGNIEVDSGADMLGQTALNIPNWGGIQNVIDKVVVQSKKSLIELSSVNNYGQYSGLTEAYNNNSDDYRHVPLTKSLSAGDHAEHTNRRMLTCASSAAANGMISLSK